MNIIIPMAGRGSRLRPHTLTVPKPLIPIAGKPIVQRLVEDLTEVCSEKVDEIHFIIGDFGAEVEKQLLGIAESLGAKGFICFQDEPLGTAHAILCAAEGLKGNVIVAFADTIFRADFKINTEHDGVIWVKRVDNPESFGVVTLDDGGIIQEFVEKPSEFVSDLAIIGVYYFKDGENLRSELQYLIDNDIKDKGEYQLTNALENMKNKKLSFAPGEVLEWLDCGNKDAVLHTNQRILEILKDKKQATNKGELSNSVIIEPCFIAEGVKISNSVVGPNVSIHKDTSISNCVISNASIGFGTTIENKILNQSMIGNLSVVKGTAKELSVGDFTNTKE